MYTNKAFLTLLGIYWYLETEFLEFIFHQACCGRSNSNMGQYFDYEKFKMVVLEFSVWI